LFTSELEQTVNTSVTNIADSLSLIEVVCFYALCSDTLHQ